MSRFEDRVRTVTGLLIDDRFKALEKLDPEMAENYAVGVNARNRENLRTGSRLTGFGRFSRADVDDVLAAALDGQGKPQITKEEEEALLIILASPHQWEAGAKEYMIEQIEQNLKYVWSSTSLAGEAAQLLRYTSRLDFVSRGVRHPGTGLHYTPLEYQVIAGLIEQKSIGAWEVSELRSYLRIPAGGAGAWGFHLSDTDDIYIISGLSARDRYCSFTHEVTHAIQDFHNVRQAGSPAMYIEADAYIAQAFASIWFGMPYAAYPNRPEEVAYRGASHLLSTPTSARNDQWKLAFRKAYDEVVDAYVALKGNAFASEEINMRESDREQEREKKLMDKMRKVLIGKKKK